MRYPIIIGIGGYASSVGKTTLLCELLRSFPGWEAIKTTRGHYRSCGKDPHACCVSHLLGDEPLIRSGREETYAAGKDTGRYWDAGAANVHWVIATDAQIGKGIREAVTRVKSAGVFVEGNSFAEFVQPDGFLMIKGAGDLKIKKTAKRVIENAAAMTTLITVTNLQDELPLLIARVKDIYAAGTTQSADRHLSSAGLIEPLTQAG